MRTLAASTAIECFDTLLDMVRSEPVRLQEQGRDVAVVLSLEEFRRLSEASLAQVNPSVERLHAESVERWGTVYEAVAN